MIAETKSNMQNGKDVKIGKGLLIILQVLHQLISMYAGIPSKFVQRLQEMLKNRTKNCPLLHE